MKEKGKLNQKLRQELQWIQYRMKMLDLIEGKLIQMREIAEKIKNNMLDSEEVENLNTKLNNLATQVRALDEESKKNQDRKILE